MMVRKSLCCPDCFKKVAMKDTRAAKVWMKLCDLFALSGSDTPDTLLEIFGSTDENNNPFRVLEQLDYLVSTETDSSVLIKLSGYTNGMFCVNREKHD